MRKKILLLFALLLAAVQGAWAVWDGSSYTKPTYYSSYDGRSEVVVINSANELAWIRLHWDDDSGDGVDKDYYEHNFYLNTDIDMGDVVSYIPMGDDFLQGTFYGNGHTIRIHIWGVEDNYQGLFSGIDATGRVQDVHVAGKIECANSRLVGGICGENRGQIDNCWVSADISSGWREPLSTYGTEIGGIAGQNYRRPEESWNAAGVGQIRNCIMTGNVSNNDERVGGLVGFNHHGTVNYCVFYGTVITTHDQESVFVGKSWEGQYTYVYNGFPDALWYWTNSSIYGHILNPYAVNIGAEGPGTVEASYRTTYPGSTVRLTPKGATLKSIAVTDADGKEITLSGNATDGYTFTMPRRDVNVVAIFSEGTWPHQGTGTEADPYVIAGSGDWAEFAYKVNTGSNDFSGKFIRLDADISVQTMAGAYTSDTDTHPFCGTFDGGGHTLNINVTN